MKADRELDARIAEKVFEQKVVYVGGHPHLTEGNDNYLGGDCPHFSTQIADAWLVVEKLRGNGWVMTLENMCANDCVGVLFESDPALDLDRPAYSGRGAAPLAICLAALAVVERRGR